MMTTFLLDAVQPISKTNAMAGRAKTYGDDV